MTKARTAYVCQNCAYASPRWQGKCPNCGQWNTFVEELSRTRIAKVTKGSSPVPLADVELSDDERISTRIAEFDRVLGGGGIVRGSVILLGGDPGVGKSTLMLQLAAQLTDQVVLYVSGEESARQIRLRVERLGIKPSQSLLVLAETNVDVIAELVGRAAPGVMIVDSIQTMVRSQLESSPGSVAQVRESAALITRLAKQKSISVFFIGHVTKEGMIAGPKTIEHMVDTVLQFEGEQHHAYRILRAVKNRFGSTNEIGVFQMNESGLEEVRNPSEVFLSERSFGSTGSTIVASVEGTRPILVEVQALVTPTSYGIPQRNTTGFDYRRLGLLIAVLEKRLGLMLGQYDVFANIAGGVRIDEPAADLGISASILSSMREKPIDPQCVAIGEIGLGGEVRTVSQVEKRVQESAKLGFQRIVVPKNNAKALERTTGIEVVGVERIDDAMNVLLG